MENQNNTYQWKSAIKGWNKYEIEFADAPIREYVDEQGRKITVYKKACAYGVKENGNCITRLPAPERY